MSVASFHVASRADITHEIVNSCRTRPPRITYKQAKFLCPKNFRGASAPSAKGYLVGKGLTMEAH